MRHAVLRLAALFWLAVAPAALAAGPELNVDGAGVAMRGFDPVAYFTTGRPMPGLPAYAATHDGARYNFNSAANRDAFIADPAKYLPQYGGYCAYAAALGKKADADPTVWRIKDGKLYLNYNRSVGATWERDVDTFISKADAAWPAIKGKTEAELK